MAKVSLHDAQRIYADYCEDPEMFYKQDKETSDKIAERRKMSFTSKPLRIPETRLQRRAIEQGLFLGFKPKSSANTTKPAETSPPIKVK